MIHNDLENEYFEWMYHIVCDGRFAKENSYRRLLEYLNSVEYTWLLPDDANRADDGSEGLRWQFMCTQHIRIRGPRDELDSPCSVLEMMLALAFKCEDIMDNASLGDRTSQWFWKMVSNLGLAGMTDRRFDLRYVEETIERFLAREYESDGHGSLFIIRDSPVDLRKVDTWTCMLWYIDKFV
jgi:hypothetical protein